MAKDKYHDLVRTSLENDGRFAAAMDYYPRPIQNHVG
jgi:hypothetical protein